MIFSNAPASIPAHAALALQRSLDLEKAFKNGEFEPYVWPWDALGITVMIAYMLAPPTSSRLYFYARYPLFAYCVYSCTRTILFCRSKSPPLAYGIGIVHAFALAWISFHVIWRDTRTESNLLVWEENSNGDANGGSNVAETVAKPKNWHESSEGDSKLRQRSKLQNDHATKDRTGTKHLSTTPYSQLSFDWQTLPTSILRRLYWITTMILALRGEGTSHGISILPSLPIPITTSLQQYSPTLPSPSYNLDPRTPLHVSPTNHTTTLTFLTLYLRTYLIIDLSKYLFNHDAFFLGLAPIDSPFPSPPSHPQLAPTLPHILSAPFIFHPTLTRALRLLLALLSMLALLQNLTALAPLLLHSLLRLRHLPILYPSVFGTRASYASLISKTGLAGWWGLWWHQMFRLSFEAPTKPLLKTLRISPRSMPGKLVALFVAFGISACIHAAGSFTNLGREGVRPWRGSGVFFLLQPVGIVGEMGVKAGMKRMGLRERGVPAWVGRVAMLVWVHIWLYWTAPLLAEDVARGGVWLTEPVPLSLVSGVMGEGWVRWEWWMLPYWHWGEVWWKTGLAC